MSRAQRDKGKRGEREVASILRRSGFSDAHRTSQYCGNTGDASDVVGIPGYHIEVKRCETVKMSEWTKQAEHDAAEKGDTPLLIFRRSGEPWRAVMLLDDLLPLLAQESGGVGGEQDIGPTPPR